MGDERTHKEPIPDKEEAPPPETVELAEKGIEPLGSGEAPPTPPPETPEAPEEPVQEEKEAPPPEPTEEPIPEKEEAPPPETIELAEKGIEPLGPGEAPPTPPPETPEADEESSGHDDEARGTESS